MAETPTTARVKKPRKPELTQAELDAITATVLAEPPVVLPMLAKVTGSPRFHLDTSLRKSTLKDSTP